MAVLNCRFTYLNNNKPKYDIRFWNQNCENKILTIVKAEFAEHENLEIFHFCDILNDRTNGQKYASFEGSEISQNPWFYRLLGIKKASLKDAFLRNSRSKKQLFSAKCKKSVPSSALLEGCLDCLNPYFWHLSHVSCQLSASLSFQSSFSYPSYSPSPTMHFSVPTTLLQPPGSYYLAHNTRS